MPSAAKVPLTYVLLFVVAIPWYWQFLPASTAIIFGMPAWVISAIVGSAAISCYTGWLLSHHWAGETEGEPPL